MMNQRLQVEWENKDQLGQMAREKVELFMKRSLREVEELLQGCLSLIKKPAGWS